MMKFTVFVLCMLGIFIPNFWIFSFNIIDSKAICIPNNYTIEWKRVIYQKINKYVGWPTIAIDSEQILHVVFSGDREFHVDPYGKILYLKSLDFGDSWSEPEVIVDTVIDDRDPGIIITKNKKIIVSFFTSIAYLQRRITNIHNLPQSVTDEWKDHNSQLSSKEVNSKLGNWVISSNDNGKHWGAPVRTIGRAPHGPIQLSNKNLLLVGKGFYNGVSTFTVESSNDNGHTWNYLSEISVPSFENMNYLHEPHVVETKSHKLIALFRYEQISDPHNNFMRQSESIDMGKTWSPIKTTTLLGFPAHLLLLKNGWILATYGRRTPPFGIRACISKDEGRTWDIENEIILSSSFDADLGYPSSVQLQNNTILTIYYQKKEVSEKPCLIGTKWHFRPHS